MEVNELLSYIYEHSKVEDILEKLDCHNIKEHGKEYRCGMPNHTSTTAISVSKDDLMRIRVFQSDGETIRGNIITLAMTIRNENFYNSLKWLHEILELPFSNTHRKKKEEVVKKDPLSIFTKHKKRRFDVSNIDMELYDETVLIDYIPLLHENFWREGILEHTRKEFNIGYDMRSQRIVIPHSHYLNPNEFVGIMGRSTNPNADILNIPKYFPLKPFPKSMNLYGYAQNYKYIIEDGICCVFEGEKSVLKLHSRNIRNCIAIGSHNLSDYQVKLLIALDSEIVIAYDKDVSLQHIRSECERFYNIRPVSYIWDKWGLLKAKESPADAKLKTYKYMLKNRVKYDESEHQKYIKGVV